MRLTAPSPLSRSGSTICRAATHGRRLRQLVNDGPGKGAEGVAQVAPALATGMLGAVIHRNGKGGYRLEDGAADAVVMRLPSFAGAAGQPTSGGTDGPQVTCAPAGTSAQSIHGPTYWGLCCSKAGNGPALITNLAPGGMAEGVMV